MKKWISWLLVAVMLWAAGGFAAFGHDSSYLSNARFHSLTRTQATEKHDNGEKFILYCYRSTCPNCQYIGSTAVTSWMNDYGQDIYGVDIDTEMPMFAFRLFNYSVSLPGVLFIDNDTASIHQLSMYSSLNDMKTALDENFFSFTGLAAKTLSSVSVASRPTKTQYCVGESFDESGLTLTATYSDGSTQTVTSGFTCTGFSSAAEGTKTITVSYTDGGVTRTAVFTVTVVERPGAHLPGDVDNDGTVTLRDAALISRYLVGGWNVVLDADAADVNDDGSVTLKDAALISRYIVGGWNVVLI